MKNKYYETIFAVTETCQNGNERRIKKSVFSPIFKNGRNVIQLDRIDKGIEVLKSMGYYNIEYIDTKKKELLFID
jgi:hypothetical protein